jgi:hypothetical protein
MDPPDLTGYTFLERLGSGGFSDVFLYERQFPRQKVAIKVLVPESLDDTTRQRFTAEANAMASVSTHPYIVTIYQADISAGGHPFLVMEYYPRPNFSYRARTEKFSVASVLRVGIQVAAAVETAHRSGILHRDIKPANILTSEYGLPGLTDFGIAVADDDRHAEAGGMSVPWSPPEVVVGSGRADERADVYSLAATIYTLLAARSPFEVPDGQNRSIDLIDRIERMPVPPIERPDVPGSLQRLLSLAMAKDPAQRPGTAAELARALQVIEVEQRFDMTRFEVRDDDGAPAGHAIDADAGATRARDYAVVHVQEPTPGPSGPVGRPPGGRASPAGVGDTVSKTFVRPPGSVPPAGGGVNGLIHHTPYQPAAQARPLAAPTAVPPVAAPGASAAYAAPAAGTYVAPQPEAVQRGRNPRLPLIAAGVGAAVLAGALALVLFGRGGGGEDPLPTITAVVTSPTPDPETGDFPVRFKATGMRSDDRILVDVQGEQGLDLPADARSYQVPDPGTCSFVTVQRGELKTDPVKADTCTEE